MSNWDELATRMLAASGPAALVCRQWLMRAAGMRILLVTTPALLDGKH